MFLFQFPICVYDSAFSLTVEKVVSMKIQEEQLLRSRQAVLTAKRQKYIKIFLLTLSVLAVS